MFSEKITPKVLKELTIFIGHEFNTMPLVTNRVLFFGRKSTALVLLVFIFKQYCAQVPSCVKAKFALSTDSFSFVPEKKALVSSAWITNFDPEFILIMPFT